MGSYEATHMDAAGLWALAAVNGRISSMLKVGGHTISNLFWNHLLKDYEEVRQFQVVSHEDGSLTLRFRGAGFEQAREAQLRGILNEFLGPVPVAFQWMEQIPLTRAGKLLQVVKE